MSHSAVKLSFVNFLIVCFQQEALVVNPLVISLYQDFYVLQLNNYIFCEEPSHPIFTTTGYSPSPPIIGIEYLCYDIIAQWVVELEHNRGAVGDLVSPSTLKGTH